MDSDLRILLVQLLASVERINARLTTLEERVNKVEAVSHTQITEDDLEKRYREYIRPKTYPPPFPYDPNVQPLPYIPQPSPYLPKRFKWDDGIMPLYSVPFQMEYTTPYEQTVC